MLLNLFNTPETELALVAEEYHKAAKLLIEKGVTNDLAAYPIVYLYRHALELSIKSVLILADEVRVVQHLTRCSTDISCCRCYRT